MGNASETVINALLLRLEDGDNSVRNSAAQPWAGWEMLLKLSPMLCCYVSKMGITGCVARQHQPWALGNASETVTNALLLRLEDGDNSVRLGSGSLGRVGKCFRNRHQCLLLRLEDGDNSVRSSAASALGGLGNASEAVISALVLRLEDGEDLVRSSAAEALGKLGNASETVINALLLRLEDRDNSVRVWQQKPWASWEMLQKPSSMLCCYVSKMGKTWCVLGSRSVE